VLDRAFSDAVIGDSITREVDVMKPIQFVAFLGAAFLVVTSVAEAGQKPGVPLNRIEVQQLVARGGPADQPRLSAHFVALAERYSAEAQRHSSMSRSFAGNPRGNFGTGMSAHCKQLADLNTKSAVTVRELAAYHANLANGGTALPPADAAKFQGGAGAPEPTRKELNALAAKASTPAEHHALMEYFSTLAKRYSSDANEHVALAQTYRGTRLAAAAAQHDTLALLARAAEKEAMAAATMHEDLATITK
jgi:hypothetical protein